MVRPKRLFLYSNYKTMMIYEQTLEYLYSQVPAYQREGQSAYKPGLDNSYQLDEIFGQPHTKYPTIHVGGTNGKGSTSHTLAAILQKAGYKVGLYTSPHLIDFRERIRINGEMIPKEYVVQFVEKYKAQFEPIMPSFFELTMEMAFLYFAEQQVDVAIVEVGLGGRLDSTNIISPDLSIITNIGLDHTQFLGNTLAEVATEKAGVIKADTPVVIGEADETEVREVFLEQARVADALLLFADKMVKDFKAIKQGGGWQIESAEFPQLYVELGGFAQEKNARTVLAAVMMLRKMNYNISDNAVVEGFSHVTTLTGLMGRWQTVNSEPRIICDTGHNEHAMRQIVEQLKSETYDQLHIVIGMVDDKDVTAVLKLLPKDATYYFTQADIARAIPAEQLAEQAGELGLTGSVYPIVQQAVEAAQQKAANKDLIFIGGSSFIVADALPIWLPD